MSTPAVFPPIEADVEPRTLNMSLPFPHLPKELKDAIIAFSPHSLRPTIALVYHFKPNSISPANLDQTSNSPANCIFTELNLTLSSHYGRYPLILPCGEDHPAYEAWAAQEARVARDRREVALTNKLAMFLGAATVQKLEMVRVVKIESCPAVTILNMAILSLVQATLRELEIVGTPLHIPDAHPIPNQLQILDTNLLSFPLSFPELTHIRMGVRSMWTLDFCTIICNYANSAQTVDANFESFDAVDDECAGERFPRTLSSSRIQRLRVTSSQDGDDGMYEVLADYIKCSPLLSQIIVSNDIAAHFDGFGAAIDLHRSVRDLCWSTGARDFVDIVGTEVTWRSVEPDLSLRGVRRLVLSLYQWVDIYDILPPMPDLERLYLDFHSSPGAIPMPIISLSAMPQASLPSSMLPYFAASLRLNSKLRTIHTRRTPFNCSGFSVFAQLDEIEYRGAFSGYITSMVHDGVELLHARLLQDVVEISDGPTAAEPNHPTHLYTVKHYIAADGTARSKTYERRAGFAWVHYTDFEGLVVPLEVIAEMKRVEGGMDWEKREVDVGKAAWQVLLDWQKEVLGEAAADTAV